MTVDRSEEHESKATPTPTAQALKNHGCTKYCQRPKKSNESPRLEWPACPLLQPPPMELGKEMDHDERTKEEATDTDN